MKNFLKNPRIFVEVLVFAIIFILIGYFLNRDELLFTKNPFNFSLLFLAIITLYYGLGYGLLVLSIFAVILVIFYESFQYKFFLEEMLFTLIFGKFHFAWVTTNEKGRVELKYIKKRLKELGKTFFSLKISHDQLEKSYIQKSISIRSMIEGVKEISMLDKNKAFEQFLRFFARTFNIEASALYLKNTHGKFEIAANIGNVFTLNEKDLQVKDVLQNKTITFVSVNSLQDNHNTDYLAVIPCIASNEELKGLLIIKEMSFLSFNRDNLQILSMVLSYFIDQIELVDISKPLLEKLPFCPAEFAFELTRLSNLQKKFNIESNIAIFHIKNNELKEMISLFIESKLRSLDLLFKFDVHNGVVVVVLLPFAGETSTFGFIERIKNGIKNEITIKNIQISYGSISLNNIDAVIRELSGFTRKQI